jgi:hypothetical protein
MIHLPPLFWFLEAQPVDHDEGSNAVVLAGSYRQRAVNAGR